MGKKTHKMHIAGAPTKPIPNVSFVRAMSDEEALRRAKADPDAQPLTTDVIKKLKRVPHRKQS